MDNKTSPQGLSSIKNEDRISTLVEKLRSKLKNFAVVDRQGQLVGKVKDLMLDTNRQLNLVVLASEQKSSAFLLISKLIEKIDPQNKSVSVNINKAEIDNLPEYLMTETSSMDLSQSQNNPVTPAGEAANETTMQDSSRASAGVTPTPNSESLHIQEQLGVVDSALDSNTQGVLEEEIIRLLGERLIVDRSKRKVGEVIVRKEIETRMIQVPVRHEKLIVEQVSPERKQLAEIDLGQQEIPGIELSETTSPQPKIASLDSGLTVSGEFTSPKIASLLLNAIALERRHGCKKVRVEIVVEDAERQKTYQEWFDRCSGSKNVNLNKQS